MNTNLLTYSKKEKRVYLMSMVGQNILYGIFMNTYAFFAIYHTDSCFSCGHLYGYQ